MLRAAAIDMLSRLTNWAALDKTSLTGELSEN